MRKRNDWGQPGSGAIQVPRPGFVGDPFAEYGRRASQWILGTVDEVPADMRKIALRALLDELDESLWAKVAAKTAKFRKNKQLGVREAMERAMASAMAEGIAREVVDVGKKKGIRTVSLLGLGAFEEAQQLALDGVWGRIKSGVKKAGKAVKKAGKWTGKKAFTGAKLVTGVTAAQYAYKQGKQGVEWAGGKTKAGLKSAYKWAKKGVNKLGGLSCKLLNSGLGVVAGGAAAAAMGAPPQVGAQGVQAAAGLCKSEALVTEMQQPLDTPAAKTFPLVSALAVGGAVVAVALLARRRGGS